MQTIIPIEPVDYLVIGHVTQDLTPKGPTLGGTASYAALTANALGLRVGIVTAFAEGLQLPELEGISISAISDEYTTTFENIQTPAGRIQYLHHKAPDLDLSAVPETWRSAPIVHLGPVCQEVDPNLAKEFSQSFVGLTPQGWFRTWDAKGRVRFTEWPEASYVMENASAAVLSVEDVKGNENLIEEMVASIRILIVTEGAAGARLYWNGDLRRFTPPTETEIDPVGAGDIFATAFFFRLYSTHDPWESARFATQLAANSVTRRGLLGVPTPEEVQYHLMEIIPKT
jgi:sugar/nucleoside kinase (ribokinase family)